MYKYTRVNSTHENMLRAVVAFALASGNLAITSSVPAFLALINAVKTNLGSIETLRSSIAQSLKGYSAQKKANKAALIEITNTIMKAAYAYAVANNLEVLSAQMKTSRSRLKDMKYVDLIAAAQSAINIVTPLVASLAGYGITGTMITQWQTAHDNLNKIISDPKNAIANRIAVNKQIQNTLRQCMQLITEQADTLALVFAPSNKKYYNEYLANRKLNPYHLSTQLRAHVQDELNQPIAGATVAIEGTNLSGTTDKNGYCLISNIPFGDHTVTVTTSLTPSPLERAGVRPCRYGPFHFKKGKSLTKYFTTTSEPAQLISEEEIVEIS